MPAEILLSLQYLLSTGFSSKPCLKALTSACQWNFFLYVLSLTLFLFGFGIITTFLYNFTPQPYFTFSFIHQKYIPIFSCLVYIHYCLPIYLSYSLIMLSLTIGLCRFNFFTKYFIQLCT